MKVDIKHIKVGTLLLVAKGLENTSYPCSLTEIWKASGKTMEYGNFIKIIKHPSLSKVVTPTLLGESSRLVYIKAPEFDEFLKSIKQLRKLLRIK
jgi:hypothetical protein